ncbi:unnamed protein product, partial [Choristocarpus tenellus]
MGSWMMCLLSLVWFGLVGYTAGLTGVNAPFTPDSSISCFEDELIHLGIGEGFLVKPFNFGKYIEDPGDMYQEEQLCLAELMNTAEDEKVMLEMTGDVLVEKDVCTSAEARLHKERKGRILAEERAREENVNRIWTEKKVQEEREHRVWAERRAQREKELRVLTETKAQDELAARLVAEVRLEQEKNARISAEERFREERDERLWLESMHWENYVYLETWAEGIVENEKKKRHSAETRAEEEVWELIKAVLTLLFLYNFLSPSVIAYIPMYIPKDIIPYIELLIQSWRLLH